MVEVKNEVQEETMREVGHLLLEVKCLARLGALASDSCICDDDLQLNKSNDNYYIYFRTLNKKLQKAIKVLT